MHCIPMLLFIIFVYFLNDYILIVLIKDKRYSNFKSYFKTFETILKTLKTIYDKN